MSTLRIGEQRPRLFSLPHDINNTDAGDEVIEFARRFGVELDDWQKWVVRQMCAEDSAGNWAATNTTLLVPRQCGKSAILEVIELAALFLWDERHIIYSAHLGKTAADHQRRMARYVRNDSEYKKIARVLTGKGDERIERSDTGAILEFITRGKKTSRGGSPNRVIFDEAMFLTDDQIQAMVPALSAQSMNEDGGPQMIYASSAPIAESAVLHRQRSRGINDKPPRMFFAEWSVNTDADVEDRDNWYIANPGLGIRISEQWIEDNELGTLSPHAFAVERLGIPEEPIGTGGGPIAIEVWQSLTDGDSLPVDGTERLALEVAPDRSFSTFGIAGKRADNLGHVSIRHREPGTSWVVDRAKELTDGHGCPVTIVTGSPAAALIPDLELAGVPVDTMSPAEFAGACQRFVDAVNAPEPLLRHRGSPDHTAAVAAAQTKPAGDGGFVLSRRSSSSDITPLTSAVIAWARVGHGAAVVEAGFHSLADYLEE